jgi:predicted phage gp36 major capsid-like protein
LLDEIMAEELDDLLAKVQQRADAARLEAALLREDLRRQRERIKRTTEDLRKQNASIRMTLAQTRHALAAGRPSPFQMYEPYE